MVTQGSVRSDQSVLTGESAEVEAGPGSQLFAGSVLRRGEATGEVTATASATYYGQTAELVRTAKTVSHLEETIFRVVWALLAMDGALVVAILVYGLLTHLALTGLLPFVLILVVASVPVALPATFTLATALGAVELARAGVLVTRLPAIEEAAAMDLVCTDKTGTITQNKLSVVAVHPYASVTEAGVLALAAAASDEATQDPIDLAVLSAARSRGVAGYGERLVFTPFDPATKRSEAVAGRDGARIRVIKGAPRWWRLSPKGHRTSARTSMPWPPAAPGYSRWPPGVRTWSLRAWSAWPTRPAPPGLCPAHQAPRRAGHPGDHGDRRHRAHRAGGGRPGGDRAAVRPAAGTAGGFRRRPGLRRPGQRPARRQTAAR